MIPGDQAHKNFFGNDLGRTILLGLHQDFGVNQRSGCKSSNREAPGRVDLVIGHDGAPRLIAVISGYATWRRPGSICDGLFSPPPARIARGGEGSGVGVYPQTRQQRRLLRDPPHPGSLPTASRGEGKKDHSTFAGSGCSEPEFATRAAFAMPANAAIFFCPSDPGCTTPQDMIRVAASSALMSPSIVLLLGT